ncbi:hypothetical protein ABZ897_35030 [Nonomuraea sp. NPDC046802]|uniref:hypothetical protein n=1 Tax=Nonomuraea sp. NPDC046802 TaxID=3154919 RepID=UPI0033D04DE2
MADPATKQPLKTDAAASAPVTEAAKAPASGGPGGDTLAAQRTAGNQATAAVTASSGVTAPSGVTATAAITAPSAVTAPSGVTGWVAGAAVDLFIRSLTGRGPQQRIAAAIIRGFVFTLAKEASFEGALAGIKELAKPANMAEFVPAYEAGVILGFVSPVTDLFGIVVLSEQLERMALDLGRGAWEHPDALIAEARALGAEFKAFLSGVRANLSAAELLKHLDELGDSAERAAGAAGAKAAHAMVLHFSGKEDKEEQPLRPGAAPAGPAAQLEHWATETRKKLTHTQWSRLGYNVGYDAGAALSNALLFVVSMGAGEVVTAIGGRLGKLGGLLAKAGNVVGQVGEAITAVEELIAALMSKPMKWLEPVMKPFFGLLERLRTFLRGLLGLAERGATRAAVTITEKGATTLTTPNHPSTPKPAATPKPLTASASAPKHPPKPPAAPKSSAAPKRVGTPEPAAASKAVVAPEPLIEASAGPKPAVAPKAAAPRPVPAPQPASALKGPEPGSVPELVAAPSVPNRAKGRFRVDTRASETPEILESPELPPWERKRIATQPQTATEPELEALEELETEAPAQLRKMRLAGPSAALKTLEAPEPAPVAHHTTAPATPPKAATGNPSPSTKAIVEPPASIKAVPESPMAAKPPAGIKPIPPTAAKPVPEPPMAVEPPIATKPVTTTPAAAAEPPVATKPATAPEPPATVESVTPSTTAAEPSPEMVAAVEQGIRAAPESSVGAAGEAAAEAGLRARLHRVFNLNRIRSNFPLLDIISTTPEGKLGLLASVKNYAMGRPNLSRYTMRRYARDMKTLLKTGGPGFAQVPGEHAAERLAANRAEIAAAGAWPADVAPEDMVKAIKDKSVLMIPDDHVGPVREFIREQALRDPGAYELVPGPDLEGEVEKIVRRVQPMGITSGRLNEIHTRVRGTL